MKDGGEEQQPATVREIKEAGVEAALRDLVFAGAVDAPPRPRFSSLCSPFSLLCFFFFLPHLSPLSLLHQPAVVTFFFLSAVCSAWHSVWRMMVTPEGGRANVRCTLPSPPLTTTLYITARRATRHRRAIERGVLTLTPYLGNRDAIVFPMLPPGITTLA